MSEVIFKEESYDIIGACFEVHNRRGSGFLESVYHDCLGIELTRCDIPYQREKELDVTYRDQVIDSKFYVDFLCFDKIIVEIKSVEQFHPRHKAQVMNYLKASGFKLGLLVNFGDPEELTYQRVVL